MEGPRPTRCLAAALALVLMSGCASDLWLRDGRAVHRELDFSVALPPADEWERVQVEGAWLAYRHRSGAHMSLQTRCFRRYLNAQLRARHLLIGVAPRELLQSGPAAVGSVGGWTQVVAVGEDPVRVRLKTVTLLVEDCAYDWLLTARDDFDAREPGFDAWWQSFERAPAEGTS
jgi:hypothetical protein